MQTITPAPVDAVRITTVMDNITDLTLAGDGHIQRRGLGAVPRHPSSVFHGESYDMFRAEHGFSAIVEFDVDGSTHRLLFDAGLTPDGVIGNLDRLEIPIDSVEAIVLSHGHFDHTGGMAGIIDRVGTSSLPVLIHPDFWSRRRVVIAGRDPIEFPSTSRSALEGAGFGIIEDRKPSFLFSGSALITGEIDRTTDYEPGMPGQEAFRDGVWTPDVPTLDDQALVLNVAGKGLVIISGCGHAGIVNTMRYVSRLTGVDDIHAVVGGFHLGPPAFHGIIDRTVDALEAASPAMVVPAHCTGWLAQMRFAERLPHAFAPNAVGTTFHL